MKSFNNVKACYTIQDAWRDLALSGQPGSSCRCPWRDDRNPSFSVHDEGRRFKDFSTGESGDVGDFVARATGWSTKDALEWCRGRLGIIADADFPPQPISEKVRRELVMPPVHSGTKEDWLALARLRRIDPYAVEIAATLGVLAFGIVLGFPCWMLQEPGKIAEARRMDGAGFPPVGRLGPRKAHTLAGSRKDWPIGSYLLEEAPVAALLVEGGPDWLAAMHHMVAKRRSDLFPVAMMGRTNGINPQVLPLFQGRRVRIYPHDDPDGGGLEAAMRWARQIREVGGVVDAFTFDGLLRADGGPVKDLNDTVLIRNGDRANLEGLLP